MSRSPELRASLAAFKRRLLAAVREDLFGHFERTISGYEDELDRNRKLLDAVSHFDSKRRGAVSPADVLQPVVTKEEAPEQRGPSSSLDQRLSEPPHIKEEQGEGGVGAHAEDCGGSEPDRTLDPDWRSQPEIGGKDSDSPESESDGGDTSWEAPDRKSLRCSVCGKAFGRRAHLNTHMRTHTGEKPFSCSLCGKRFTSKTGLNYHLKTHTGEKPFSCSVCGRSFRQKVALTHHSRTHTGEKPFSCSVCGKRFGQKAPLTYHLKTHTGEKPFSCSVCGQRFRQRGPLNYHMLIHTGLKPFSCSVCNRRFRGTAQRKIHKCAGESPQPRCGRSEGPPSCSRCEETSPKKKLEGQRPAACSLCGQKRSHLKVHTRSHTGERPRSRSTRGKRFSQKAGVIRHTSVHSAVTAFSETGAGEDCGGPEPPKTSAPHIKAKPSAETDHSVVIDFQKDGRQCHSGFTDQQHEGVSRSDAEKDDKAKRSRKLQSGLNNLKKEAPALDGGGDPGRKPRQRTEERQTRRGEKLLSCLFCGQRFSAGAFLARHVSVHTGEKLLRCIVCGRRFTLESDRTSHRCVGAPSPRRRAEAAAVGRGGSQVTRRPGEKSFRCSVCDAGFSESLSLVTHMRVHALKSQFTCSVCGMGFTWRRNLTKHIEGHAQERRGGYGCRHCKRRFARLHRLNNHKCVDASSRLHQAQTEEQVPAHRLFSCSQCGKGFSTHGNLSAHVMCHMGQEPLCCPLCNTGCADSEALIQHMGVHARHSKWSRSICGKRFVRRKYLTKHMEDQTKEKNSSQTEEDREAEPPASSSAEHMETEADGEDCGGPEPAGNPDPDPRLRPVSDDRTFDFSEPETDDGEFWKRIRQSQSASNCVKDQVFESGMGCSADEASGSFNPQSDDSVDSDFWKESRNPPPCSDSLRHSEESQSERTCDAGRKHLSRSESGETFSNSHPLKIHVSIHTGEEPSSCSTCGEQFPRRAGLSQHMATHTGGQGDPEQEQPEPPHIKEEQEELWSSQEGEQLGGLEEADITRFIFTPVPVKTEEEEEKPQSSQLHQGQTEEDREAEPPASSSAEHMETEADGEDCGGPEPAGSPDPDPRPQPVSDDKSSLQHFET